MQDDFIRSVMVGISMTLPLASGLHSEVTAKFLFFRFSPFLLLFGAIESIWSMNIVEGDFSFASLKFL